jgi:hypothetical protein
MPRAYSSMGVSSAPAGADFQAVRTPHGRHLSCEHCQYALECVDQSRRTGTWLGSFICPNCRSEYFYAYRWGRLVKKM